MRNTSLDVARARISSCHRGGVCGPPILILLERVGLEEIVEQPLVGGGRQRDLFLHGRGVGRHVLVVHDRGRLVIGCGGGGARLVFDDGVALVFDAVLLVVGRFLLVVVVAVGGVDAGQLAFFAAAGAAGGFGVFGGGRCGRVAREAGALVQAVLFHHALVALGAMEV